MPRTRLSLLLSIFGALAFLLALLSIVDILVPRPYDGVVLETDAPGSLRVREVLLGSGAERAGILPGDRIVGIDRTVLRSTGHAAALLARRDIGDSVPYLVRRGESLEEVQVELGRRFIGSASYLFACLLGFSIFGVGLFVRSRQREMRAAQIFFLLSALFLLFLVCRLRPASYGWIDGFVLEAGALALVLLPASFLHFFLVFPTPVPLRPRGARRTSPRAAAAGSRCSGSSTWCRRRWPPSPGSPSCVASPGSASSRAPRRRAGGCWGSTSCSVSRRCGSTPRA